MIQGSPVSPALELSAVSDVPTVISVTWLLTWRRFLSCRSPSSPASDTPVPSVTFRTSQEGIREPAIKQVPQWWGRSGAGRGDERGEEAWQGTSKLRNALTQEADSFV